MAQPSEQPQDVMVYSYEGDTTVRVQWSPVFVKDAEAQLEGYRVSIELEEGFYCKNAVGTLS